LESFRRPKAWEKTHWPHLLTGWNQRELKKMKCQNPAIYYQLSVQAEKRNDFFQQNCGTWWDLRGYSTLLPQFEILKNNEQAIFSQSQFPTTHNCMQPYVHNSSVTSKWYHRTGEYCSFPCIWQFIKISV